MKLANLLVAILLLSMTAAQAVENVAGKVGYMSGTLVAQRGDGTVKVLATKSDVLAGDMLITAKDSYAQIQMNDGSKMTLRPNSNLRIEAFSFVKEAPQTDNAVFRLLKGGFRTVTGLIGKRGNPDAYRLNTSTATIGIRGTDFSSRLCASKDCLDDESDKNKPLAHVAVNQSQVVGRVMLTQGDLNAKDSVGKVRKLTLGAPVYEGDELSTGKKSYAVVAFRDEGRVSLQENTVFHVEKFKYDKAAAQESAVLRLLKGGVRVVSGLIGRINHDDYQFRVATATIGIRGTGFDAWCNGSCANNSSTTQKSAKAKLWTQYAELSSPSNLNDVGRQATVFEKVAENNANDTNTGSNNPLNGMGVYVWAGEVVLVSDCASPKDAAGCPSQIVGLQQAAIIARDTGKPVQIKIIPQSILNNATPRPDSIQLDMQKLFGTQSNEGDPGLYVTVHDGNVILVQGDKSLNLGRGETGFSNQNMLARLASTPAFMGGESQINSEGGNPRSSNPSMNPSGCAVQ